MTKERILEQMFLEARLRHHDRRLARTLELARHYCFVGVRRALLPAVASVQSHGR